MSDAKTLTQLSAILSAGADAAVIFNAKGDAEMWRNILAAMAAKAEALAAPQAKKLATRPRVGDQTVW